ncbi:hypothetical protein BKA65DRAFT_550637 [Rhexocercosporidium sp. MPI-PUGE-AT-0058]|nr:hypothetical protein BKA65DRAFT_550637 [Rhexocercosporidium sp. MPI-PUGE-AT-0058]
MSHMGNQQPNATVQPARFSTETDCTAVECFKYEDEEDVEMTEATLSEASLPDWLSKTKSRPSTQPSRRVKHGLRIIVAFDLIQKHFGLHELFMANLILPITLAFTYSPVGRTESRSGAVLFVNLDHFGQISLIHDPDTKITYGLLVLGSMHLPSAIAGDFLRSQLKVYSHPLLLLIRVLDQEINLRFSNMALVIIEIDKIQYVTGQYQKNSRSITDVLLLDFTEITRSLNFFAETSASAIFRLKRCSLALSIFETWNASLSRPDSVDQDKDKSSEGQTGILEKLEYVRNTINGGISIGELAEKRIEIYRQLIYQLMAQKDSRANIELAKSSAAIAKAAKDDSAVMRQIALETKRDSSAMKTIAMLTMVFLPATSIAAIFAMPVIEWDSWDSKLTGLSLYWVVTLPLTLVVFMIWGGATVLPWRSWLAKKKGGNKTKQNDEEMDELDGNGRVPVG